MAQIKSVVAFVVLSALGGVVLASTPACSSADCKNETCGNGKGYQSCVEGNDFVVRDMSGKEYSRCHTDYDSVTGKDANDCAYKHAESKAAFCN